MIKYLIGDATSPVREPNKNAVIAHICNDQGGWGAGFVLAISKHWSEPEEQYRQLSDEQRKLGFVDTIKVEPMLWVANMVAQHGFSTPQNKVAVRYPALDLCLAKLYIWAKDNQATVHMPRIGCGLAGGKWSEVEKLINKHMDGIETTVYDFK